MSSPTDAELLAERTALRKQVAALEGQMAAYRQAKDVATALAQVGKELAETLDVAQVTDRIVTTIMRLVRGRRAALFQHVPVSGELVCVATAGEAGPEKWLGRSLPPGEGIAGRAVAEGHPIWSADLLTDPRIRLPNFWRERLEDEGYRASVGLPLIARGTVVGALVLSDAAGRVFSEDDLQLLTIFAAQAALALENARLYQEEQLRRRQLEAIRTVGVEVTRELDLSTLLGLINRRAAELVGAVSGVVWLWDSEAQVCIPQAWHGHGEWLCQLRIRSGQGVAGTVAQRREGLIINDYRNSGLAHPLFLEHTETTAVLAEPLLYRDQLLGVITVDNQGVGRYFTEQDRNTLTLFAAQAAIAIENARLHTAALRRGEELAALLRATRAVMGQLDLRETLDRIAAEAVQISGCSHVKVLLLDRDAGPLRVGALQGTALPDGFRIPLGTGLSGLVARTGQPVFVTDPSSDPRNVLRDKDHEDGVATYLGLPIRIRDEVLGVLTFNTTEPRQYSPGELTYLTSFADQAAIAIENARLFASSEWAAREARSLYEVAHSLTTSLDLTEVLHLISAKTTELLGTPHAQVVLWDEDTKTLRLGAAHGTQADQVKAQAFRLGEGVNGLVAQTRAPLIVNDYQAFPHRIPGMPELVAVIGVPLLYRDRLLGVLTSHATAPGFTFTPEHLALLTSFADQAAIAIENARLFAELNQSYHDLQQAQDELIRSEKLRALGQMAAGIAHDLNNILAAILGQVELLRFRVPDPALQDGLNILETAATDGAHVVRRLQDFARQRARSALAPMDLADAVEEALEITRPRWRDEPQQQGRIIEVRTSLEGLPPILGHAPEVREAVTNLILNAVDAMPAGGALTLRGQRVNLPNSQLVDSSRPLDSSTSRPVDSPNQWVELGVTDTGSGMSEEVRRRIFEPFFTTKGVQGTGLGLSVVYGIMERHGGHIQIASSPGRGTTVTLRFQVASGHAEELPEEPSALSAARRILLIDDDPNVREALGDLLRAIGHQVVEADGGATGIAKLAGDQLDIVLTDLGMPGVTGWDVARAVKSRTPRLPIVLLTGWGDQAAAQADERGLVDRVLAKPFRLEELVQVIRDLTGDGPPVGRDQVEPEP